MAYASRAMSSSEINYAQIEKELLAIVYGCERFNMYPYGAEIEVLSDHKPLESIFKKPLFKVPPRLQRMRLRLQKYNLKVRYVPGKFLHIADTLSRAFDQSNVPTDDGMHQDMEHFIHSVILDLPISDVKLMELRQLNDNDSTMQMLHRYAMEGWPQHKRDVPPSLKSFWNVRNDIHVTDGILLKDNRLVIPLAWRTDILQKLHLSHCGIEKTKANARTTVFWPGMNKHIEDMVSCCEKCLKYQSKQTKEPMQTRQIPILPWQIIASDVLEHKNQNYLVFIDSYSKYIEAMRLNGKTSSDIIRCLNEIFSRHGYPQTLIADNMPYNSREMRKYATQYGIHIITTSPTYSQANGLAEKAVHIVKNLLRKECNLNEGLMEYRNTPISNFPYSPNQMLFSRQIRTKVPVHPLVLVPQICHDVPELLEKRQAKYKEFYDRQGSKQLPQLKERDSVRFKKPGDKHLSPAIVTRKHETPRSHMITDETGREYRRNRRHIHHTQEPPVTILNDGLIDESQPVTMHCSVNSPRVTRESDADPESDPPDTDSSSVPRRSSRVRSVPVWHRLCHVKTCILIHSQLSC